MKRLLKNCLLLNNFVIKSKISFVLLTLLFSFNGKTQITNYVSNGSFESLNSNSLTTLYNTVKHWQSIDTGQVCEYLVSTLPTINNAPYALGFQYPRTGNNYIIATFYCQSFANALGYPRNRLKTKLKPNVVYCAKYYLVNTNNSPYATDGYGIYFADSTLDAITNCNNPLTFLTPQIQNPSGNIITDTLRWTAITGTFVATGYEKYMVLGNFKNPSVTNTLLINPTYSATIAQDICIDDASCIELNLPAFAGRDTVIFTGDSVFLGREPDVGIDEASIWYKMTSPTTSITIDTIAGILVKPVVTTTYVVRQEIGCGVVKWDTVVIYMDAVGIEKLKLLNEELKIYPVPASDFLELRINNKDLFKEFNSISIYNNLGQLIRQEELNFEENTVKIKTDELQNAVYSIQLRSNNSGTVSKRFVISR